MKCLAAVTNEFIIKKMKAILLPGKKTDETERIRSNSYLSHRIDDGLMEFYEGKGVKLDIDNLWK